MYRFVVAVALLLLFSGCIDIYIDIFQHPDGSYTVRKMPALSHELVDMLGSLATIGDSTKPKTPPQEIIDTMKEQLSWERAEYEHLPGVLSYSLRDSTHDSTIYIMSEIHVKDAETLSKVINPFLASMDGKKKKEDPDDSKLLCTVTTKNNTTALDLKFTPNKKKHTKEEKEMVKKMFDQHYFHLRMFSNSFATPLDKHLSAITGGMEWTMPLSDVADASALKTRGVRFVVKNP